MNDKLRITYRLAEEGDLDEICALVQAASGKKAYGFFVFPRTNKNDTIKAKATWTRGQEKIK